MHRCCHSSDVGRVLRSPRLSGQKVRCDQVSPSRCPIPLRDASIYMALVYLAASYRDLLVGGLPAVKRTSGLDDQEVR
ncbi:hypothetical protein BDV29DRAFT_164681 [Aspergillus leporis]|uniref:Uncharacterized protein n=1 Tax=Aspergillus leporis TaxID=41062 RepID=A0A5N5XEY0_9EURO|nr:hypothetical protein BDV29DRAFT_164681 [Aspergillus leporis]